MQQRWRSDRREEERRASRTVEGLQLFGGSGRSGVAAAAEPNGQRAAQQQATKDTRVEGVAAKQSENNKKGNEEELPIGATLIPIQSAANAATVVRRIQHSHCNTSEYTISVI